MKKGLIIALLLTFAILSLPVSALQINASEDTFVADSSIGILSYDLSGNVNHSSDRNYGNFSEATIFITKSGGGDGDVRTFVKFENSLVQTRIIETLKLNYRVQEADCGVFSSNLYFQSDDTWNESTLTYNNMPASSGSALYGINSTGAENALVLPVFTGGSIKTSSDFYTFTIFSQANINLFDDIYNTPYTSIQSYKTGSCGGIVGNKATISTKESNVRNISYEASLVDYKTGQGTATDVSTFYFDFETGQGSFTSFPQADFSWVASTNILTPIQPAILARTENENSNTLLLIACSSYSPFSTSNIGSINVPIGSYSIICFDLKNEHSGNQFYGAIKIYNNTNVRNGALSGNEFDFYWALYSSALATFSSATFNPSPPEVSRNLTVTWTTSQNLSTGFRFRYLQNGIFSAFATIENSTQSTNHQIIIPSNLMFATLYEYQLYGSDVNGTIFTTQPTNFTAIGAYTTGTSSGNSNVTYFDFETGTSSPTYFSGADFALDTIENNTVVFDIFGNYQYSYFNGTLTPFVPKSIMTTEATQDNTLLNIDCREAPAYSMSSASQLNPLVSSGGYPIFCFDLSASHGGSQIYGAIKIYQMTVNGNSSFYWAMYSPNFVTFYGIVKNPTTPQASRAETISWQTSIPLTSQLQYSYQLFNETGYTSYFMIEDATAFRTQHSLTIPAEQMFIGDYNYFLSGEDGNGTSYSSPVFTFTVANQSSGGNIGIPVGNFLGIDTASALIVISLIITLLATIIAGVATRMAIIPVMTFASGLLIFTAMGWLPIIFALVLGIIAIFAFVKFIADTVTGTQGA